MRPPTNGEIAPLRELLELAGPPGELSLAERRLRYDRAQQAFGQADDPAAEAVTWAGRPAEWAVRPMRTDAH